MTFSNYSKNEGGTRSRPAAQVLHPKFAFVKHFDVFAKTSTSDIKRLLAAACDKYSSLVVDILIDYFNEEYPDRAKFSESVRRITDTSTKEGDKLFALDTPFMKSVDLRHFVTKNMPEEEEQKAVEDLEQYTTDPDSLDVLTDYSVDWWNLFAELIDEWSIRAEAKDIIQKNIDDGLSASFFKEKQIPDAQNFTESTLLLAIYYNYVHYETWLQTSEAQLICNKVKAKVLDLSNEMKYAYYRREQPTNLLSRLLVYFMFERLNEREGKLGHMLSIRDYLPVDLGIALMGFVPFMQTALGGAMVNGTFYRYLDEDERRAVLEHAGLYALRSGNKSLYNIVFQTKDLQKYLSFRLNDPQSIPQNEAEVIRQRVEAFTDLMTSDRMRLKVESFSIRLLRVAAFESTPELWALLLSDIRTDIHGDNMQIVAKELVAEKRCDAVQRLVSYSREEKQHRQFMHSESYNA